MKSAGGRWAAERFMAAISQNRDITPSELRTLDTLRRDEWIQFDNALTENMQIRLRVVNAMIAAGLTMNVPNGLAKTVLEWETVTDMEAAQVSMDGVARDNYDTVEFAPTQLPLPITHKDWYLNLRRLAASRLRGEPLDVTHSRMAGRKIAEMTEYMTLRGGKTFGGLTIYGLTNHPNRNTASFGTNGNWAQTAKTGENIMVDVGTAISGLEADRAYGPYWVIVDSLASSKLEEDFKAFSSQTIRQRILSRDNVSAVIVADQMPANAVVVVQATQDVMEMVIGEQPQTVQWDIKGGFQIEFKGFTIMIPLIKVDSEGRSGIFHMS